MVLVLMTSKAGWISHIKLLPRVGCFSLCISAVYFKTSEKKTPTDPHRISEEIFPNLWPSKIQDKN
jgi:hypothetical protein